MPARGKRGAGPGFFAREPKTTPRGRALARGPAGYRKGRYYGGQHGHRTAAFRRIRRLPIANQVQDTTGRDGCQGGNQRSFKKDDGTLRVNHTPFSDRKNRIPARNISPLMTINITGVPCRMATDFAVSISADK